MTLIRFLGSPAAELLASEPFCRWPVTRSTASDGTEIRYALVGHGVDVVCDADERIATIFVRPGSDPSLADLPFELTRDEVRARLGAPTRSGRPSVSLLLGPSGPWDRFTVDAGCIHVHYRHDADAIALVTLMRPDMAP